MIKLLFVTGDVLHAAMDVSSQYKYLSMQSMEIDQSCPPPPPLSRNLNAVPPPIPSRVPLAVTTKKTLVEPPGQATPKSHFKTLRGQNDTTLSSPSSAVFGSSLSPSAPPDLLPLPKRKYQFRLPFGIPKGCNLHDEVGMGMLESELWCRTPKVPEPIGSVDIVGKSLF